MTWFVTLINVVFVIWLIGIPITAVIGALIDKENYGQPGWLTTVIVMSIGWPLFWYHVGKSMLKAHRKIKELLDED